MLTARFPFQNDEGRADMAGKRKDSKGRILRTGESQRPDGRYCYKYVGTDGKPKFLYAWKLEPTDRTPKGKRDGPSLREQEKEAQRDQLDGIDHSGANMTVSELYARHIGLKPNVKPNTVLGRERRKKMLEDDPLGACRISNVFQSSYPTRDTTAKPYKSTIKIFQWICAIRTVQRSFTRICITTTFHIITKPSANLLAFNARSGLAPADSHDYASQPAYSMYMSSTPSPDSRRPVLES